VDFEAAEKRVLDEITECVIGAAIEVHRALGPGLLESIYEASLAHELRLRGIEHEVQVPLPLSYKGLRLDHCNFRLDVVVAGRVVVEIKAIEKLLAVHEAQLLSYLKLSGLKLGLLINFNVPVLKDGIKRRALSH
jgi:GxxExxY protein